MTTQHDLGRLYLAIVVPLFWIQQMFEFHGQNMVVGLHNSETKKKNARDDWKEYKEISEKFCVQVWRGKLLKWC